MGGEGETERYLWAPKKEPGEREIGLEIQKGVEEVEKGLS